MLRRLRQDYKLLKDEMLIDAYKKNGDPQALGTLYKRYSHLIFGLCMSYLKNRQDSEDAVMEIFETLPHSLRRYEIQNFESWLYLVSRNFCLKRFRHRMTQRYADIADINPDFFVEFDHAEDHIIERKLEVLSDAIDQLKEHQRRCLVLFYLENKSYKEIEMMTSYSLKEIKSFIQNGKRNLKTKITELI